ncbi:MAG: hypothetical protein HDT46_07260 [Ruminococcaceae bacterium]|nr:hypothetical protein [Oscillospiraceae bacterium]
MIQGKQKQLLRLYRTWKSELEEVCPQLVCKDFSYPYYLHIPDDWYKRKFRVLIVGEEGHGFKQFDLPIEDIQTFNREYLSSQWKQSDIDYSNNTPYDRNNSGFWNRIRKIKALRESNELSLTWTNLDKIHRIGQNCVLTKKQRYSLHQTPTAILFEEIKLLQPTHVIFFGFVDRYKVSLEKGLPSVVLHKLYCEGSDNTSQQWKAQIKVISENGIYYIFTYHPNWGQRQKGYEERVLSIVNDAFAEALAER